MLDLAAEAPEVQASRSQALAEMGRRKPKAPAPPKGGGGAAASVG
jgi:hypothetical protein